jgi:hypothetical protein
LAAVVEPAEAMDAPEETEELVPRVAEMVAGA